MDNKTALLVLMVVLIAFIVLLSVLGIVYIIALRKRRPIVKVVMAPAATQDDLEEEQKAVASTVAPAPASAPVPMPLPPVAEEPVEEVAEEPVVEEVAEEPVVEVAEEPVAEEVVAEPVVEAPPVEEAPAPVDEDDDEESPVYVTEGNERVRYDRSFTAKLCQLSMDPKEWYSALKNELLSYNKVKARMSWKRETFRIGRMAVARLAVRGKTLCLLLAVEPEGFNGTKYNVEDVSKMASTVDTPTLYRIKSARRLKYAKEIIESMMNALNVTKQQHFEPQDYYLPYEGDMALMQRGLVKRIVTGTTRTFKIEEVGMDEQHGFDLLSKKVLEAAPVAEEEPVQLVADPVEEVAKELAEEPVEEVVEEVEAEPAEEPVEEAVEEVEAEPAEEPVEEVVEEVEAEPAEEPVEEAVEEVEAEPAEEPVEEAVEEVEAEPAEESVEEAEGEVEEQFADDEEEDEPTVIRDGEKIITFDRSFTAKVCKLSNESKEWYAALKNELLSYNKIKDRMSWKRETFRMGRTAIARLVVRGKTLCLLLGVEPEGYIGTKYAVEDVSHVSSLADTPTLYRIRSSRRLKYAIEMIEGLMDALQTSKKAHYVDEDFYLPYESDDSLVERGLVKRVVSESARPFNIGDVRKSEQESNDVADNNSNAGDGEDQ